MNPIKPIAIADQIYSELKRLILTCELKPGERLVEKTLCESLEVSRASLREALNRLTTERLVDLKPNCGFSVTPITEENFKNICELRSVVESQVAGIAAKRASPEAIEQMRQYATIDCSLTADNAHLVYCEGNRAFHQSIAESIGNELLQDIVLSALDKDHQPLFYGIDLEVCTDLEEVTEEHLAIVDAIAKRKARTAEKLMLEHISKKRDRILDAMLVRAEAL